MKKARIDKLGRIVIPINYRKNLDITTDTDLIIECSDGKIEIYAQKDHMGHSVGTVKVHMLRG